MWTVDLGQLTTLTLVADALTPAPVTGLNGTQLNLPSSVQLPPPGQYATLTGSGVTLYGYTRMNSAGNLEWLMTPQTDPTLSKVDTIPVGGWSNQAARQGYASQARYLQGQGITAAVLWSGLQNFYNWAQADLAAKGWTPPPGG
jgi:hypothetical protein